MHWMSELLKDGEKMYKKIINKIKYKDNKIVNLMIYKRQLIFIKYMEMIVVYQLILQKIQEYSKSERKVRKEEEYRSSLD